MEINRLYNIKLANSLHKFGCNLVVSIIMPTFATQTRVIEHTSRIILMDTPIRSVTLILINLTKSKRGYL